MRDDLKESVLCSAIWYKEAGQIAFEVGQTEELKTYLYSEDVW
jgi:hypothetical protein